MSGRSFRNRWLVRWLSVLGGVCLLGALVLGVLAAGARDRAGPSETEARQNEELCRARVSLGEEPDAGPCGQLSSSLIDERTELAIAAGVLALLGATQLAGALRTGLTVTEPGLIIRNPLRTHRLLWSDIAGFRIERGRAGSLAYAFGRVDRVDGGTHRIEALCAMPWELSSGFRDEHVIDQLNTELARRRTEAGDRPPQPPHRPSPA